MVYKKQNFVDDQVLTAEHLNYIEDGIVGLGSEQSRLSDKVDKVNNRIPKVTAEQEGGFVRVVNGVLTVQHLTDVSKEGA